MIKRGDALRGWLMRPAMLGFWALVFWGTLLGAMVGLDVLAEGVPTIWARVWPQRGASIWVWVNAASIGLAIVVWMLVAGFALFWRLARPEGEASPAE